MRRRVLHRCVVPAARTPTTTAQLLVAIALALLCSVAFLRDSLLPGRALVPHPPELLDVPMAQAIAQGRFDPDDAYRGNVAMTDKYLQSLCWDRVMQDRFAAGEVPRWTRDIGGGAPFVPQMAQPFQPINALLLLLPSEQWYGWWFLLHQVLFGTLAYTFLRRLGCGHGGALVGLVAAVLGAWTQCKLHHNVILTAALSLWPMLSAAHALCADGVRGRARSFAIAWLGLWAGLSWSSGFVVVSLQATYITLALAMLFTLQAERGDRLRRLVPVGLGLLLGALLAAANMIPVLLASSESARTGTFHIDRLRELGVEWDHLLTAAWPDLLSQASTWFAVAASAPGALVTPMPLSQLVLLHQPLRPEDNSAFQSWVETSFAVGLVPLAAAAAALFDRTHRAVALTFAAIVLVAFGMATADEPFFSLARVLPGMTAGDLRRLLFPVAMGLVVLSALGADALLVRAKKTTFVAVLGTVAALSAAMLVWLWLHADEADFVRAMVGLYMADGDHPNVLPLQGNFDAALQRTLQLLQPGEAAHNHALLCTTMWRALLVAGLGLGACWLAAPQRIVVWLALTIGELLHAGAGPVQTVPAERVTTPPAVLQPVFALHEPNGVRPRLHRLVEPGKSGASGFPGNLPGFLRLEDAGAYNPLPSARSEEFFDAIDPTAGTGGVGIGAFHDGNALAHPLCDLFGIRFVLVDHAVPASPTRRDCTPPGTGAFRLLERTTTLPRATFVRTVDLIADKQPRLLTLADPTRDVAHRIVLEDAAAKQPSGPAGDATVTIVRHADERVELQVEATTDGYVRLADPWDAGWTATLDDQPTTVHIADHWLRAVYVPAGSHRLVFTYDGARVVWPLRLTLLAYCIVLVLLLRGRRNA